MRRYTTCFAIKNHLKPPFAVLPHAALAKGWISNFLRVLPDMILSETAQAVSRRSASSEYG
jgi:hypothetical protein